MSVIGSSESGTISSPRGRVGRTRSGVVAVALALLVIGPLVGVTGAATPATQSSIDSCTTIDEPGVYTLSQDLESSAGTCIEIAASDVTLDGAGHAIEGSGDGFGIQTENTGLTNVTVTDVTVSNWQVGLRYRNVDGGSVEGVVASENTRGMAFIQSRNLRVVENTATANEHQGIRLLGTHDSTVGDNTAVENAADGFFITRSTNNVIRDNVARRNGDDVGADGFLIVDGSHENAILRNEGINNTDDGFDIENSSRLSIVANNASYNVGVLNSDGIELRSAHHNVIRQNVANGNVDDGIDLQVAHDNTLVDNVANKNVNDGIPIAHSNNNVVRENVANNNSKVDRAITERLFPGRELEEEGSEGLTLRTNSTNNTLIRNTANGNHRQGIRIWHHAPNNTVVNNTANHNGADGIAVLNSTNNTVERNEVRENDANGIHLNNGAPGQRLAYNDVRDNRLNGILLHTANWTWTVGNVITGHATGIRIGHTTGAVLVQNSIDDTGGANVYVTHSTRIRILESSTVHADDTADVTVVRSWGLTEST